MSFSLFLSVLAARTVEAMALVTTARILIKINSGNGWMMDKETIFMITAIQTVMISETTTISILVTCHAKAPEITRSQTSLNTSQSPRQRRSASRSANRKSNKRNSRSANRRSNRRANRRSNRSANRRSSKAKNKAARWIDSR